MTYEITLSAHEVRQAILDYVIKKVGAPTDLRFDPDAVVLQPVAGSTYDEGRWTAIVPATHRLDAGPIAAAISHRDDMVSSIGDC
ncbi:MAG: hypothetical protein EPO02_13165 [Nitrospirae bacterium]|nr:MAG: hypothetical protein EPO02_13165 [Nitrospirota bacterium]